MLRVIKNFSYGSFQIFRDVTRRVVGPVCLTWVNENLNILKVLAECLKTCCDAVRERVVGYG